MFGYRNQYQNLTNLKFIFEIEKKALFPKYEKKQNWYLKIKLKREQRKSVLKIECKIYF